jgi:hypothetical protein
MFTVAWPLAPLACLLVSMLEQRAAAIRLTVCCRRPASGLRCNGLGHGNAWLPIFELLAWVSIPVNCGMIALATKQLDIWFETPLPPFEKLLVAVVAEHALLAAKLAVGLCFGPAESLAGEAAEEHRRRFLRGVHGVGSNSAESLPGLAAADSSPAGAAGAPVGVAEPRLLSVFPASGTLAPSQYGTSDWAARRGGLSTAALFSQGRWAARPA